MTQTHMRREIDEIPDACARLLDAGASSLKEAGAALAKKDPAFLCTIARGSSDHASLFIKYAIELTTGRAVASLGPSLASIYGVNLSLGQAAVISVSQSGQSPDIISLVESAGRAGALTVALTNTPASPLWEKSDVKIDIAAGPELAVAATKSYVNSAVAGLAILAEWTGNAELGRAVRDLPEHFHKALALDWSPLFAALEESESLYVLGRGPALAIASEAALKFKETADYHAEAYSSAEVLHGPVALVDRSFPVLAFAARDAAEESIAGIAENIAGRGAGAKNIPGFLGIHLEGPHLSVSRKGAHDPDLIRPMGQGDLDALRAYRADAGLLLTTLAPESVSRDQVSALAQAGVAVSLGHTDTTCANALSYFDAGARMSTHLFNAMSPLGHREPGLVGATIHSSTAYAGIIADGFHVDPVAMGVALRAKRGPGKIFIVTDAMSTIGTDDTGLLLNGRQIYREGGRLTLSDGTLAGADIDMLSSVLFVHRTLGFPIEEAIRMASLYPAEAMGVSDRHGRLLPGYAADFILLEPSLSIRSVFIDGAELE